MLIAAAAQTRWRSPGLLSPMLKLGQRSYEVYLTHMFLVFALFQMFVAIGKPMIGVPALFLIVILLSGLLGEVVARFYSEPANRFLRERWGDGANKLGSVIEPAEAGMRVEKAREAKA
jgi:peptidoglycan/LPS O-acetylase OafA/YrhL